MRPMTLRERRLMALAVLAGMIALLWVALMEPVIGGAFRRNEERQALLTQWARGERLLTAMAHFKSIASAQSNTAPKFVIQAPTTALATEKLKERVAGAVNGEGGTVKAISGVDEGVPGSWVRVRTDLRVTHDQLYRTLRRLESEAPYVVIDFLSIAADRSAVSGELEPLEAALAVSAFVRLDQFRPAPPAGGGQPGAVRPYRRPIRIARWLGGTNGVGSRPGDKRRRSANSGGGMAGHCRAPAIRPQSSPHPIAQCRTVEPGGLYRTGHWRDELGRDSRGQDAGGKIGAAAAGATAGRLDADADRPETTGFQEGRREQNSSLRRKATTLLCRATRRAAQERSVIALPLHGLRRLAAVVLTFAVMGCAAERFEARPLPPPGGSPATPTATVPVVETAPIAPAPAQTRTEMVRGNQRFVAPPRPHSEATPAPDGTVSLNFVNVEVRDVAKAVLGDVLGLKYVVEPNANGTVTLETAQPIRQQDVLPTLETSLKSAGLGLVERDRGYAVISLADARRQPALVGKQTVGYGTEVVTLRYANAAALKKLFDPMVPENAFHVDASRNVLLVTGSSSERTSLRAMVEQFDVDWLAGMSFALITLQRAESRRLVEELNLIVNAEGSPTAGLVRLIPLTRLNGIVIVSSQPQYIEDVRYWAEELDREGDQGERQLFVYRVQSGRASNLANVLSTLFGTGTAGAQTGAAATNGAPSAPPASAVPAPRNAGLFPAQSSLSQSSLSPAGPALTGGSQLLRLAEGGQPIAVTSDEANNAIVVYATSREYETVERALRKLDVLPLQVLIEAMITEVSLNDSLRYGVEWYFKSGNSNLTLTSGKTALPVQKFPGFSYLLSNENGMQAVVNALDDVTNVNVISSPRLLVLNNQTASLQVGDQVPVSTQSSVSTVSNSSVINSIEYRDTGVILKVTPRVNDGGLVLLDISQEISDVSSTTSSSLDSPTIQQRKVSSSVAVQDGQTIALGGLIRDNLKRNNGGVPVLKDIPLLGSLFGSTTNTRDRTELLVLLTPHVVRNPVDAQAVTDELRRSISAVTPMAPLSGAKGGGP